MANVRFTDEQTKAAYAGQTVFIPLERGEAIRARQIGHRVVIDKITQEHYTRITRESGEKGRPLASP